MGTLVETDIDQFIRSHKSKLQGERDQLNQYTDQNRYQGGQQPTSPTARKQWDRNQARDTRPAEESRPPPAPEETGLKFSNEEQEKKRQQLQNERQQEYNDILAKRGPAGRRRPWTPSEQGLPLGQYDSVRKKLAEERQKEMKQALEAKRQQILEDEYRREVAEEQRLASERDGLPLGEGNRQKLNEERKKEYNEYLSQNPPVRRLHKKEPTPEHLRQGLPLNQDKYNEKKRQLEAERQKEYNELLQKKGIRGTRQAEVLVGKGATLPVGEYDEKRKQQLMEERQREYNEQLQQKQTSRQRGLPPKPPTPNHFFKNLGQHDRQKEMLNEERKKEYNKKLAEERLRTGRRGPHDVDENGFSLPIKGTDSAEIRKKKARNEEYNEFLREKQFKDAHRLDHKKPPTARRHSEPSSPNVSPRGQPKEYATLPGLHYTDSAEKRKVQERNREYNEFLKQKEGRGRKGWSTPTYEEILEQKRREEALRRQEEDGGSSNMRRYASEGAINKLQNDLRGKELDKDFDSRKVRFDDERRKRGGILEDDNWLNPDVRREEEYNQLELSPRTEKVEQPVRSDLQEDMAARVRQQPAQFLASLPVGHDERDSAKRRKQADYRRELQLQMEEAKAARKREKVQELRVNASGLLDPEKNSVRMRGLEGQPEVSPRREYRAKEVQPYHTKFLLDDRNVPPTPESDTGDNLRLDLGGGGGRERGRRREPDAGLLDPGFVGLLDSRRPLGTASIPPGLMYQPSFPAADHDRRTYVTGGGGLGGPYSSIDEAYHYYGMKNPLDIDTGVGGGVTTLNLGGDYGGGSQMRPSPTPRVTFADEPLPTRRRDRSKERISPYQFPSDDEVRARSRTDTENYGAELERQIQEKRMQKMREKEEQLRYERKLEEDVKNYNPFGRGGGGAPIKDEHGNAIADLRSLQRGGPGTNLSPRRESPVYSPRPPSPRDDKIKPPPPQKTAFGEPTFARGGHGIFGTPKTDAEKDQSDKYKDELREQIAEKRRREQMEKERERMEEEKENRRLEDQRKKMQSEYDEEQKKIRAREEETRRKNEELKRQADERKKDSERKRREADDQRAKDQQDQIDRERREREQREAAERLKSPPIPTIKAKTNDQRGKSPPIPAHRKDRDSAASIRSDPPRAQQPSPAPAPSNRPNSSDVLTQLASMRKQLQSERRRVENALENSKNEPDVFDPRTIQRPPPTSTAIIERNKLIFENAVNKNASLPPPRAQTSDLANARNIQQFNELKFKADTDSRRAFRSMFPDAPVTNTTLEAQQDAMLRQQEEQLRALRERNIYDPTPSNMSYGRGRGNVSARSQLASNSAFIDVEGVNHFPEDFEDMAGARNDSARARRRRRFSPRPPSDNGMGSQASLDVDRIQRKNEDRLRRLNQMTTVGDDVSMTDPDDILDRFMAKQRYNRPPSGQTLQDDSWLRPGSKVV